MCVPSPSPQVSMLKSLSSKCEYQQVGASPSLITGVVPSSTLLLPLERGSLLTVRTQDTEVCSLQLGRGASWEPSHAGIPISDCPAFRSVRHYFLDMKPPLYNHMLQQLKRPEDRYKCPTA